MNDNDTRRPLKIRGVRIVKSIALILSRKDITPNQISVASIFFAALSALCFLGFSYQNAWWLLVLAALFIQLRLLCNLFDGMVAVEGGKSSPSGELFNDIPDRITDPMILIAAGYAINVVTWGAELGWCAGLFAVMTAYVRTLSASIGAPIDFKGPMAKQQRMAVLTIASVLTVVEIFIWNSHYLLVLALIIITVGSIFTCIRRALAAYQYLEAQ